MADENDLTVQEALQFFAERAEEADDQFAGENGNEVPDHGEELVIDKAAALLRTSTSINMAEEMANDEDNLAADEMEGDLLEALVDLFEAIGVVKYERDVDVAAAIEERIEYVEQYMAFADAMEEADTKEEERAVVEEHMTEGMEEDLLLNSGVEIGDNMDGDDYNHDGTDKAFQ